MALQTFQQWFHLKSDLLDTVSELCPLFQPICPTFPSALPPSTPLQAAFLPAVPLPLVSVYMRGSGGEEEVQKGRGGMLRETRWKPGMARRRWSPVTDAMERRGKMKAEKTWEDLAVNGLLLIFHSLLREVVLGEKRWAWLRCGWEGHGDEVCVD